MSPETNEFVYVPIPESRPMRTEFATPYTLVQPALVRFEGLHRTASEILGRRRFVGGPKGFVFGDATGVFIGDFNRLWREVKLIANGVHPEYVKRGFRCA
jgi:hypothetical protein